VSPGILPPDPHFVEILRIELRADQTNTGDGNDHESAENSEHDHGDLLSNLLLLTPFAGFRSTQYQTCNETLRIEWHEFLEFFVPVVSL
jgi:hypothetical protein